MHYVVSLVPQPLNDSETDTHVREKSHPFPLYGMDFFLGQPSSIFNRLLDVFLLEIRIVFQDFLESGPMSNLTHNDRNWDTHAAKEGCGRV